MPEQSVARRYAKLRRDGVVRVVGLVNPRVYGECQWVVRVRTKPDGLTRIAETLARLPEVTHANVLSGWTELVCIVRAPLSESEEGLLHRLPRTSSVLSVEVDLVLHAFPDVPSALWTDYGHTLDADQCAALAEAAPPAPADPVAPNANDQPLLDALSADGRISHSQLAERTGWSAARVKRRIAALEASSTLTYDVDVLPERLGFPVHALVWMNIPPRHVVEVAQHVGTHREVASVVAVTGANNLMAVVIAQDVEHLYRYLTGQLATVDHIDRCDVRVRTKRLKQAGSVISHGRLV